MILSPTYMGKISLGMSWTSTPSAVNYKVFMADDPGVIDPEVFTPVWEGIKFTTFVKVDLPSSASFYFKIYAYDVDEIELDVSNELLMSTRSWWVPLDSPPYSIITDFDQPFYGGQKAGFWVNTDAPLYWRLNNVLWPVIGNPDTYLYEEPFSIPLANIVLTLPDVNGEQYLQPVSGFNRASTEADLKVSIISFGTGEERLDIAKKDFVYPAECNPRANYIVPGGTIDMVATMDGIFPLPYKVLFAPPDTPFDPMLAVNPGWAEWVAPLNIPLTKPFEYEVLVVQQNVNNYQESSAPFKFTFIIKADPDPVVLPFSPELAVWVATEDDVDIMAQFPNFLVRGGSNVMIVWALKGEPIPDVEWMNLTNPSPPSKGVALMFDQFNLSDAGSYRAEAVNSEGALISDTITINFL